MMNEKLYEAISKPFRSTTGIRILGLLNKGTKYFMYVGYLCLVLLSFSRGSEVYKVVLIPGLGFVGVSTFRKLYNAPRPYEVLDIVPLIPKDTIGKSFPSRHCFSSTIISMTACYVLGTAGIVFWCISVIIYALRIIGGIHFPKDVIAGCLVGIVIGSLFWII